MKELTIEEKAKRYDEALALMQDCIPDENGLVHVRPEEIFPELKESEDERIRKELLGHCRKQADIYNTLHTAKEYCKVQSWVAWLEKQREQKPTDEEMKTALRTEYEKGRADAIAEMQKPTGWSEEDEQTYFKSVEALEDFGKFELADWLKEHKNQFLKP